MTEAELLAEHEATIASLRAELAASHALNVRAREAFRSLKTRLDEALAECPEEVDGG